LVVLTSSNFSALWIFYSSYSTSNSAASLVAPSSAINSIVSIAALASISISSATSSLELAGSVSSAISCNLSSSPLNYLSCF